MGSDVFLQASCDNLTSDKNITPYCILHPTLNNIWMTAMLGWGLRVTDWATFRLFEGRKLDLVQRYLFCIKKLYIATATNNLKRVKITHIVA